ncbi:MAG: hypothetical protein ACOYOB_21360, partial [Myxococcota bacterium]
VTDVSVTGIPGEFKDCVQASYQSIDLKAKCKNGDTYTVFLRLLNRIPKAAKGQAATPPPPARQERGFLEEVGHSVMNEVRADEKRKATAAHADANASIESILAPPPPGVSERWVGRPVNARFVPLQGRDNRSLFGAAKPLSTKTAQSKTERLELSSQMQVAYAAATSFVIGSASVSQAATDSDVYTVARAIQLLRIEEVDDSGDPLPAPPGAKYYVHAVYYGRSYELYFRAKKSDWEKKGKVGIDRVLSMSLSEAKTGTQEWLSFVIESRGLALNDKALFVDNPVDFRAHYASTTEAPDPVPVLVEYRRIVDTGR